MTPPESASETSSRARTLSPADPSYERHTPSSVSRSAHQPLDRNRRGPGNDPGLLELAPGANHERRLQAGPLEQGLVREDVLGHAVGRNLAAAHDHDAVRTGGELHVVGDPDHGGTPLLAGARHGADELVSAARVDHGGRLVEHDDVRAAREHAGKGHALLLAAGERMDVAPLEARETHVGEGRQRRVPRVLLVRAKVARAKGDVLPHHGGDELVLGVLEDHAARAAQFPDARLVRRVDPGDVQLALL